VLQQIIRLQEGQQQQHHQEQQQQQKWLRLPSHRKKDLKQLQYNHDKAWR